MPSVRSSGPTATRSRFVVTGAHALVAPPCADGASAGAGIAPSRWVDRPARLSRMDRLCALGLVAADGALLDARRSPADPVWDGERTAISFGSAFGCHATNESYYRQLLAEGRPGASPRLFAYTLPSSPVGEISIHHRILGPATAVVPGRTAGLAALAEALRHLEQGRATSALAVAAEVSTPLLARLLEERGGDSPATARSPSQQDGAAALFLEDEQEAAQRGAALRGRALAVTETYAAGRRASAVADAARRALAEAELDPGALTHLIAAPEDAAAVRPLGVEGIASWEAGDTLGAAALVSLVRWLEADRGVALVVAGDPEGAAAAAIFSGEG